MLVRVLRGYSSAVGGPFARTDVTNVSFFFPSDVCSLILITHVEKMTDVAEDQTSAGASQPSATSLTGVFHVERTEGEQNVSAGASQSDEPTLAGAFQSTEGGVLFLLMRPKFTGAGNSSTWIVFARGPPQLTGRSRPKTGDVVVDVRVHVASPFVLLCSTSMTNVTRRTRTSSTQLSGLLLVPFQLSVKKKNSDNGDTCENAPVLYRFGKGAFDMTIRPDSVGRFLGRRPLAST